MNLVERSQSMKIKKLDIYGYGKWVDQQFDIHDNLQLFYGQNEAGKSTLQSFIRSMLFGFPTKRKKINQQNRYEPKNHETYGGRILLTDTKFGDVWLERTSKTLSLTTTDGEVLPTRVLSELLGGLDETLFDNFYAFNLQNLQELSHIDATQLNEYFLSIGTLGSDQFLKIAKQFEKESDALFRPSGQKRPLNLLLQDYDQLAKSVESTRQNLMRYSKLVSQRDNEELAIETLNQEIAQLEQKSRELDKLISRYDTYIKDKAAVRELEELVYTPIPDKAVEKLNSGLIDKREVEIQLAQLEERIRNLSEELLLLTKLNWAVNHEDDRRQWLIETQKAKEVQMNIESLSGRIQEQENMMDNLARQGQFFPEKVSQDAQYIARVEDGLVIRSQRADLTKQQDDYKAERKVYLEQRKQQQNYSATVRQQIAKLEAQRMNEEVQLMQSTKLNHYFLGALFAIIGLVIMGYVLVSEHTLNSPFLWMGAVIGLIGIGSLVYIFSENRKQYRAFHNSPIVTKIQELKEKEVEYHEQSKMLGTQINQLEEAIQDIELSLDDNTQQTSRWLADIGFYPTADPEIILKANPVLHYFAAKDLKEQLSGNLTDLIGKIDDWKKLVSPIFERFPFAEESIRQQIRHVEDIEVSLARTQERGRAINQKIVNSKETIQQLSEKLSQYNDQINALLQSTNSQDETEFFKRVEANAKIDELTQKHELYQEQISGFEASLADIESKQSLLESMQRLDLQIETMREKLVPHHHSRANLAVEIQFLEQDGTYSEKLQLLADKKAEVKEAIKEWGQKRLAMSLIIQTLQHGLDNPVPEMTKMANALFSLLNDGRYTQIHLSETGVKVKHFSDIYFEPHELSQGTLEQLYVALRLSFIENVKTMVKMPIFIDDAFVNFDEHRKLSMYKVLEQVGQNIQVLFFTFDSHAKEVFSNHDAIDLDHFIEEEM